MFLYKNNKDKSIIVYSFIPDNVKLVDFKKKHFNNIKSVKFHINNPTTVNLLFNNPTVMFNRFDRKEDNGKITFVEETNNNQLISEYINGDYDSFYPVSIFGDVPFSKSIYSGDLNREDCTLLFSGGSYHCDREFVSDELILLNGLLDTLQPLLSDDINNLLFPDYLDVTDKDITEFFCLFECKKQRIISLDNLKFLHENYLIQLNGSLQDALEKSETVLNCYNKVKKKVK